MSYVQLLEQRDQRIAAKLAAARAARAARQHSLIGRILSTIW